jgi:uncharacterized protein YcbX
MVVKSLFEYPVKGLRGNEVCCASINSRGLNMDRRWILVDSENSFLSQRQIPAMANLLATVKDQLLIEDQVDLSACSADISQFADEEEVEVWGQVVGAKRAPESINQWLSVKLGRPVKLFYMADENIRPVRNGQAGEIVSFADGYPLLLTGSASLADLNARLDTPVDIDRFRTNIHLDTKIPFEEEAWQRLKIGDVTFRLAKKCARCTVINVDQASGKVAQEPLKTLSTYRREGNKVNFGVNLVPESYGLIHEGDNVEIID